MTPATRQHWEDTCAKLAQVSAWIGISYEPIDLLSQPEIHLLMLQGLRDLTAVVLEGTYGEGAVSWVSDGSGVL
jgi:hypothetical protein